MIGQPIRIANEVWEEFPKILVIRLKESYHTAKYKFGWQTDSPEGFSVSHEALKYAEKKGKYIGIHVLNTDKKYKVTPSMGKLCGTSFNQSGHNLLCIPEDSCDKLN